MANLKNITDLPVAESAEGLNLIVNDNGSAKQIAVEQIAGGGGSAVDAVITTGGESDPNPRNLAFETGDLATLIEKVKNGEHPTVLVDCRYLYGSAYYGDVSKAVDFSLADGENQLMMYFFIQQKLYVISNTTFGTWIVECTSNMTTSSVT